MRKTSFYFSFLALPRERRRAIIAVWDFCRVVDDAVDLERDEVKATASLDEWRREIGRVFDGGTPTTPEGRALQPVASRFRLPRDQFDAVVDGVAMDVTPRRYETFADLESYCHRVASAVGLICAEIFGYQDRAALVYARDLGVALQLTNILRDVGVDYRNGRLYLPLEDLARVGCTEDDIKQAVADAGANRPPAALKALLAHQAARARQFFNRAVRSLPAVDARRFVAAEIMRAIYFDVLQRIEAADYDVFSRVIRARRSTQAYIAVKTLIGVKGA
jgi:15-cis-phytoene synthase